MFVANYLFFFMKNSIFFTVLCLGLFLNAQKKLPNTSLKTLSGSSVNLSELANNNELFILSLWATWCVPCKNELDAVSDVYEDWVTETGVTYFAVSIDDSRTAKRVKPMVNGKDWAFEILLDENSDLKRAFGVSIVPYTIIVKSSEIVYTHTGYTAGFEDELYAKLLTFVD
mgnify:CR=1 FL=1|tara:strand:+ start:961 stop:1473 length:513 start_codon:yes stop_codon:yes gene_type:complete